MIRTGDNIAIDIAASMMIIPGLEARLGTQTNWMIKVVQCNISQEWLDCLQPR